MRILSLLAAAAFGTLALAGPANAGQTQAVATPYLEQGVARWGADFRRFAVSSGNPNECAQACNADGNCRAWTFVKAGIEGPQAQCRLKSAVPYAASDPCCVSGISAGASVGLLAGYEGVETAPKQVAASAASPKPTATARLKTAVAGTLGAIPSPTKAAASRGEGITASVRPRPRGKATAPPMALMPTNWER